MQEITAKCIQRIPRVSTIESFRFLLPEKISFIPGQFLEVVFAEANRENRQLNKYLSFSSSPTKEYIEVTKRLSNSPFSQRLKNLKIGDEVLIRAPLGSCVFKDDYKKIGFLIGGIGITPVISILDYIIDTTPFKQGLYTPGARIPVFHPDAIKKQPLDYLLLLAWNYADQIVEKEGWHRERGGKFIIPVPDPEIL